MTYHPFEIEGADRPARWLVTCDHANNHVPGFINGGSLGISDADMARHIAYDIGAAGVSREMAKALNGPVILSNFSRLVIDPNRGEDDPTLIMQLYDGTIIPGNREIDAVERQERLDRCYRPYHTTLAEFAARQNDILIVAIHSFTPQLQGGHLRPWHLGILYADDERLTRPFIDLLAKEDLCVGENEPYGGHLPGDSIDRHAIAHQRPNVLIEIRSDLIETEEQQISWARRLAPILEEAAEIGCL